jgi:alpha-amylase
MTNTIQLCLSIHNHQPIGNFDGVIEQAYRDSYLPFLEVFEPYEHLSISLHTSGPLMIWLAENHPEYLARLKALVVAGRIEILGGPFYEPILTMLPSRDRKGQIERYTEWLNQRFETQVSGMWMPERVWESQLVRDIAPTGMEYTILDDYHFRAAGCQSDQLTGYYLTEDDGQILRVFPGSEKLRYLIPYSPVEGIVDYARSRADAAPGSVLVFGDDGEKFGTWPDTHKHVYTNGWLRRFFDALTENRSWLHTRTLNSVIESTPPVGKIYLPDCSYREMTEWVLPVDQQASYQQVFYELQQRADWDRVQTFIKGGYWRNFKVKYSETNEMYARMLEVSDQLVDARQMASDPALIPQAEDHLYRGQCNCPYWHGAFGGVYLPHLRNATFRELIAADNLLQRAAGRQGSWVDVQTADFNLDLFPEVKLSSDQLIAYVAPATGGMLYELDMRSIQHNLLATMQRRPEAYHDAILKNVGEAAARDESGTQNPGEEAASIHDRVHCKQQGLEDHLQYDQYARKSMMDHFFDNDASLDDMLKGHSQERGDFVELPFHAKIRRGAGKVQLQLSREGNAWGVPIKLTKALTIEEGSDTLLCNYLFENLPPGRPFHYAMEWNFAGMPAGADDRYFYNESLETMGQLGDQQDIEDSKFIGLVDQWLGVDVQMQFSRASSIWAFPIRTVSQSEAGFELVHQSVCVMPHWIIQGDSSGRWSVNLNLTLASRHQPRAPNGSPSTKFASIN